MATGAHDRDGVILLHGHRPLVGKGSHAVGPMGVLARSLGRVGYRTFSPAYPSIGKPLNAIVDHLADRIDGFAKSVEGDVHFVAHSLGGLIARAYLARHRLPNLGHVVMLSTPNHGSEWADLCIRLKLERTILGPVAAHLTTQRSAGDVAMLGKVSYSVGVIAGDTPLRRFVPRLLPRPNDGTVSVASTRVEGMADHIVLPVTHALMPFDPEVQRQTACFLNSGRFTPRRHRLADGTQDVESRVTS